MVKNVLFLCLCLSVDAGFFGCCDDPGIERVDTGYMTYRASEKLMKDGRMPDYNYQFLPGTAEDIQTRDLNRRQTDLDRFDDSLKFLTNKRLILPSYYKTMCQIIDRYYGDVKTRPLAEMMMKSRVFGMMHSGGPENGPFIFNNEMDAAKFLPSRQFRNSFRKLLGQNKTKTLLKEHFEEGVERKRQANREGKFDKTKSEEDNHKKLLESFNLNGTPVGMSMDEIISKKVKDKFKTLTPEALKEYSDRYSLNRNDPNNFMYVKTFIEEVYSNLKNVNIEEILECYNIFKQLNDYRTNMIETDPVERARKLEKKFGRLLEDRERNPSRNRFFPIEDIASLFTDYYVKLALKSNVEPRPYMEHDVKDGVFYKKLWAEFGGRLKPLFFEDVTGGNPLDGIGKLSHNSQVTFMNRLLNTEPFADGDGAAIDADYYSQENINSIQANLNEYYDLEIYSLNEHSIFMMPYGNHTEERLINEPLEILRSILKFYMDSIEVSFFTKFMFLVGYKDLFNKFRDINEDGSNFIDRFRDTTINIDEQREIRINAVGEKVTLLNELVILKNDNWAAFFIYIMSVLDSNQYNEWLDKLELTVIHSKSDFEKLLKSPKWMKQLDKIINDAESGDDVKPQILNIAKFFKSVILRDVGNIAYNAYNNLNPGLDVADAARVGLAANRRGRNVRNDLVRQRRRNAGQAALRDPASLEKTVRNINLVMQAQRDVRSIGSDGMDLLQGLSGIIGDVGGAFGDLLVGIVED